MNLPALPEGWPCPTLHLDDRSLIAAASAGLCRLLGRSHTEIVGQPFDALLTGASRVLFQSYLQPLLQLHGNVEEISLTLHAPGGTTVDVLFYSARWPGTGGGGEDTAPTTLVTLAPIHRRRSIEAEMLRIKRAADQAPGLIFQLMQLEDGRRHFPFVSEAVRRLYETTQEAALVSADALFGRMHDDDRPAVLAALNAAADRNEDWTGCFRVVLGDGQLRWHELQCTPRELAGGVRVWHGHIADVTQRRDMENALAERTAADRMAQVRSEFLARVSHELRTPLNGIIGFTQLLTLDGAENLTPGQRERLDVVTASGHHLLQLVDQVLDITSLETLQTRIELGPVPLARCVAEAVDLVRVQAGAAGIALDIAPMSDGWTLMANRLRLRQVLVNLLSNAIKYNRPAGRVTLRVLPLAQMLRVSVSDEGVGMTQEQMAGLFQPFNRLGAQHSGTEGNGLGLVITRHLLTLMGGTITVDSTAGRGSTFAFTLPQHIGAPAAATTAAATTAAAPAAAEPTSVATDDAPLPASAPSPGRAGGYVLCVEDNPVNAVLMEAIIGMRPDVRLQIASTAAQALQMLQSETPDLLLLDMHLPDMMGSALLAEIRRRFPGGAMPAVAVSAAARADDVARAIAAGFAAYWTKPLDIDRTLAELDKWLAR